MRVLILLLLTFFACASMAIAYPKEEIATCITGVKRSPVLLGVPEQEIANWCDCVLQLTIDEAQDPKLSSSFCGQKHFR